MVAMQLSDAVVLVTGASAGIGHAAAARFAAKGAQVLVHGRDAERTQQVVSVVVPGVVDTGFFESRGSPYGRTRPRPIPAETVADAVVRAVERDRAEEWRPRWLRIAPTVRALAPGAYRRLVVRFGGSVRAG